MTHTKHANVRDLALSTCRRNLLFDLLSESRMDRQPIAGLQRCTPAAQGPGAPGPTRPNPSACLRAALPQPRGPAAAPTQGTQGLPFSLVLVRAKYRRPPTRLRPELTQNADDFWGCARSEPARAATARAGCCSHVGADAAALLPLRLQWRVSVKCQPPPFTNFFAVSSAPLQRFVGLWATHHHTYLTPLLPPPCTFASAALSLRLPARIFPLLQATRG